MAYDLRRESLKSLFLITRLAIVFLNLLVAGGLAQEMEASGHNSNSNEPKETEKEHHEEEENEEDQKIPRIDPKLVYLYSKILLLVVVTSLAFAILITAVSRADFWQV
ncbi:TPA: hypothetical protein H1016_02070 [archaeon]|uniref:Uncharacterized protein n=1 Tax=Candidatus Naiadarchaeum limnaeum TaxID=2756139 RepID=A0A832XI61_9ARCH|nr:hypothetical protein [Candidatus Naiadarchaeum limnaeum]